MVDNIIDYYFTHYYDNIHRYFFFAFTSYLFSLPVFLYFPFHFFICSSFILLLCLFFFHFLPFHFFFFFIFISSSSSWTRLWNWFTYFIVLQDIWGQFSNIHFAKCDFIILIIWRLILNLYLQRLSIYMLNPH